MDCRFANIYSVKRQFEGILSYGRGAYKKEMMGQSNLISGGDKNNKKYDNALLLPTSYLT